MVENQNYITKIVVAGYGPKDRYIYYSATANIILLLRNEPTHPPADAEYVLKMGNKAYFSDLQYIGEL